MDELEYSHLVNQFIAIAEPYLVPPALTYQWANRQAADFQQYPRRDGRSRASGIFSTFTTGPAGSMFSQTPAVPKPHPKRRPTKRERMHAARRQE